MSNFDDWARGYFSWSEQEACIPKTYEETLSLTKEAFEFAENFYKKENQKLKEALEKYALRTHDSMNGGCAAYEFLHTYENRDPPGPCDCGAVQHNEEVRKVIDNA